MVVIGHFGNYLPAVFVRAPFTIQSSLPRAKLMTGTFSSRSTFAFSFAPGKKRVALLITLHSCCLQKVADDCAEGVYHRGPAVYKKDGPGHI